MSLLSSVSTRVDISDPLGLQLSTNNLVYPSQCDRQSQQNVCNSKPAAKETTSKTKKKKKIKYHCAVCDYQGKSKKFITRHKNSKLHQQNLSRRHHACVDCNICKATALSDLTKCPLCSYSSTNMTGLKLHMNIHNTGRLFQCTYCEYTAHNVKDLIQHCKAVKKFRCQYIGCVFVTHVKGQILEHEAVCRWK